MMHPYYKTPRLYINQPLTDQAELQISDEQHHYLRNVMRLQPGDHLRLFNGQHGEWLGRIETLNKKLTTLTLEKIIKDQTSTDNGAHLIFAPIKKQRLDILVEKAVELGVSSLHPVITDHTQNTKIKHERLESQIIEAAEQCERMEVPSISPIAPLKEKITGWNKTPSILWCAERDETAPLIEKQSGQLTFLIGPEGGFSDSECDFLSTQQHLTPINLGPRLLRAETATIFCLAHMIPK